MHVDRILRDKHWLDEAVRLQAGTRISTTGDARLRGKADANRSAKLVFPNASAASDPAAYPIRAVKKYPAKSRLSIIIGRKRTWRVQGSYACQWLDEADNGPAMSDVQVSIVMPHWQVREFVTLCLRSIRRFTRDVTYEVIVVDNGSKDDSLDYLRSLGWIRLIERGDATPANWVLAMATALDIGIREARGKYLLIMHTDVFFKRPGWLARLIAAIESDPRHAAAGTGKLESRSGARKWLKETFDTKKMKLWVRRTVMGDRSAVFLQRPDSPRDFCALYKLDVLRKHNLSFIQRGQLSAGDTMYLQLREQGYSAAMIDVQEMMSYMDHIAHGTAGLKPNQRKLGHAMTQRKTERRLSDIFEQDHIRSLKGDQSLDV